MNKVIIKATGETSANKRPNNIIQYLGTRLDFELPTALKLSTTDSTVINKQRVTPEIISTIG